MRAWRSVRAGGETKTRSSRRTLALPHRAIVALREQHDRQTDARQRAGAGWAAHDVVFASVNGAPLDSAKVRRGLRNIAAGLDPMPGHPSSCGTAVCRKQLRPVIDEGATAMNRAFPVVHGNPKISRGRAGATTAGPGVVSPRRFSSGLVRRGRRV
jgi:hypothetical protein